MFAGEEGKTEFQDGIGLNAHFKELWSVAVNQIDGTLYVTDCETIRKISPAGKSKNSIL